MKRCWKKSFQSLKIKLSRRQEAFGIFLLIAAAVAAFDKAVALNGLDIELNGNLNLNALGNDYAQVRAAGLGLALDKRLAAAFGFYAAELDVGTNLDGDTDINKLNSVVVALVTFVVLIIFVVFVILILLVILIILIIFVVLVAIIVCIDILIGGGIIRIYIHG